MSHTLYLQVNFRLVKLRTKTKCSGGWTKASKSFGAGFPSLWPKSIHWACFHPVELTISCSSCPIPAHGRLQCLWGWQLLLPVVYVPQVSGSRSLYWMKEWMNECMHESWHLGEWINTLMDKWNLLVALLFPLQCPVPGTVSSCFPTKTGSKRDVQGFCNLTVSKTSADGFRTSHSSRLPGSLCFKWSQSLGTRQASPPTHGGWRMEMLQREGAG